MEKNANQVLVSFESDSETSLSWETVNALKAIVGSSSLEDLIHHALVKLRADLERECPSDGGLPTQEHLAAISRLVPQDMHLEVISSLFAEETGNQAVQTDIFNLNYMLSQVTEENKHSHIDINSSLNSKVDGENEGFTIQISLESIEQVKARWSQQMRAIDNGESLTISKRLSFEDWDDFLNIFSERGKTMVEELRKS